MPTRSARAGPPIESKTSSPSTLPLIARGTHTRAWISSSLPAGARTAGVVTHTGGVSTTTGASAAETGSAFIVRLPLPTAGWERSISTAVRRACCSRAKCRQPAPARSSMRSMPPPTSNSVVGAVDESASMNRQCSASVASDVESGLATIEPVASTPRSHASRSTCPPMAAARRKHSIATAGSATAASACRTSCWASASIAATGRLPSAEGGSRPSRLASSANTPSASARAEAISNGMSPRTRSCTCAVTAGSPLSSTSEWARKDSSVSEIPPVTRLCRNGRSPPGETSQA